MDCLVVVARTWAKRTEIKGNSERECLGEVYKPVF
jgi:hypothetical protein